MTYEGREKRKNSDFRRMPAWVWLVGGFVLGIVFILIVQTINRPVTTSSDIPALPDAALMQTATAIIQQATASAQGAVATLSPADTTLSEAEQIALTATAIISDATRQAGG